MPLRILPAARRDLNAALEFTAERWGLHVAQGFMARFQRAKELIEAQPRSFRLRPEYGFPDLRFAPVGQYLLIYRTEPLEALRFVHGSRDLEAVIDESDLI